MWNDFDNTFKFRLNNTYTSSAQFKPFSRFVYVIEEVTSSTSNNTKVIYVPDDVTSIIHPDYMYISYAIVSTTSNSGLSVSTIGYTSFVLGNNNVSQTIDGVKTFSNFPVTSGTPTSDTQLVNKKYVDDSISSAITDALQGGY